MTRRQTPAWLPLPKKARAMRLCDGRIVSTARPSTALESFRPPAGLALPNWGSQGRPVEASLDGSTGCCNAPVNGTVTTWNRYRQPLLSEQVALFDSSVDGHTTRIGVKPGSALAASRDTDQTSCVDSY